MPSRTAALPPPAAPSRGQRARDALLAAARLIAAEQGWHAVTVRRVAERAERSPALVYEYFASKDALLVELVRDGFRQLQVRVAAALADARRRDTSDDWSALAAMARAYWAFARDHADLYQVMYGLGGTRFPAGDTWAEGAAVGEAFVPVVAALSAAGAGHARGANAAAPGVTAAEVERRVYTLWATVHGLVALVFAGRIEGGWPAGEALALEGAAAAAAGWQAGLRAPEVAPP